MRIAVPMTVLATALACLLASAPAHARARTFVASYGNDANPCTFGSPCKTFQVAVNAVDAGGEVTAIDSAGFGPIKITKAVTITSPDGVEAGIIPDPITVTAITINAGSSDTITLRGLTISTAVGGQLGVNFMSGAALHVENSVFRNLGEALAFSPNTASDLYVSDTAFTDNDDSIIIQPAVSGEFTSVLNHIRIENSQTAGVSISDSNMSSGALGVTISDSTIARTATIGVAVGGEKVFAVVTILNSRIVNGCDYPCSKFPSSVGVEAFGQFATILLNGSAILQNATGWTGFAGGHVLSYGNNQIDFNPSGGDTAPPSVPLK
jgi:hypothetical protein